MAEGITIQGLDDCLKFCDGAPKEMRDLVKKAMREGAKASRKLIKKASPKRWQHLTSFKVKRRGGTTAAAIGYYNKHQHNGQQPKGEPIDDWFKAYWSNYGTLTKRDPAHHFQKPIRGANQAVAQRRRNNVGQEPKRFFERAIKGYDKVFVDAFQEYIDKHIDDCYGK